MAKKNKSGGKKQPQGALAAVKQFLTHTIDKPDEAKAKALLTAQTVASGAFHLTPEMFGARYSVGEPYVEKDQLWIPVEITSAGEGGASQTMTLPMAPVEEDGQWKLDMAKTIDKVMGGMDEVVDQMAQAVGQVMEGVGEAIASGLQGLGASSSDSAGPAIDPADLERFKRDVLHHIETQMHDQMDLNLPFDVDFPSLLTGADPDENRRLLDVLRDRVLTNWTYWIREVNEKIPLQDRVKAVRLEGVRDPGERVIFAEGARLIYRLNLSEDNGCYQGNELLSYLAGSAAGMAESAPPGDALGRGPSYRPSGDVGQVVANYKEFVLPALTVRIAEMLGRELPIDIRWDLFTDRDDVAGLWLWGVNRVCGAMGLLLTVPEIRDMRGQWNGEIKSVEIVPMPSPGHRAVRMEADMLRIFIDPSAGEAGCFYEVDIAEAISNALKLELRPKVAELERYAKARETSLEEIFGRPIKFAFDWDTFTGHPEVSKSVFALTLLREHGIDALYYALTAVAEKNPNFKQQVPKRIAWLYLDSVPTPEEKGVHGEQTTIANHVFLFEGYNGYLTQKELEARLPAIVAGMPDQDWGTPEPAPEPAAEMAAESDDAAEPQSEPEDYEAQAFANMKAQMQALLPAYANQLQLMVGRALPLEIAWDTLDRRGEAVGQLLNASLTPVLGGLGMLGQDGALRQALAERIDRIVLKQSDAPGKHGFSLDDRLLIFSAVLSPAVPTMDPQTAANLLRALLTSPAPKSPAKAAAPDKSPAKPAPAKSSTPKTPASKKAASKKPAKAAPKKAPPKRPAPRKKRK